MTYKQRETSREIRLWIGQVIVPGAILAATIIGNPQVKTKVATKFKSMKDSVAKKFKKD